MPERSFGRLVRFRRTKLGISQAKLAELVGRSPSTIRSWERDRSIPNDEKVLVTLSAILGVDERTLFDKAGQERPVMIETSPTIEEELATLTPETEKLFTTGPILYEELRAEEAAAPHEESPQHEEPATVVPSPPPTPKSDRPTQPTPALVTPPEPYVITTATPSLTEPSYVEEPNQRQLYRVRTVATLIGLILLVIAFLWGVSEGFSALGDWWDDFIAQLRL